MESVSEMHDQVLYGRNAGETSQRTSKKRGNSKKNPLLQKSKTISDQSPQRRNIGKPSQRTRRFRQQSVGRTTSTDKQTTSQISFCVSFLLHFTILQRQVYITFAILHICNVSRTGFEYDEVTHSKALE